MDDVSIKRRCTKCGKMKEVCCHIDGKPWCVDCFLNALESKDGADVKDT